MPFVPGDRVHVVNLGTGIVREARHGGRYVVEVKGRPIVVPEGQLERADERRRRRAAPLMTPGAEPGPACSHTAAPIDIDLHGMTAIEALAAVDAFLSEAMLAGYHEVRLIHGRSGGVLRAAVHRRLAELPSVRGFRLDPRNPGVTVVRL